MTPLKPFLLTALYEWIIENDRTPYILVQAESEGVRVPKQFISDGKIILNVHPDAIDGWHLDSEKLCFSARFSGKLCSIEIPLKVIMAIYAKENGKGMMFDEDLDSDMNPDPIKPAAKQTADKKKKPALKVVK